jgi:hypothetical protein
MATSVQIWGELTADQAALHSFLAEAEGLELAGFFWCGGYSWDSRDYRSVVLAKGKVRRRYRALAADFVGIDAKELIRSMRRAGLRTRPAADIATCCESAPSSPKPPRKARSSS